jgi:serine/threonine protein kinase HipA of HipAB toxin-antitoxin module
VCKPRFTNGLQRFAVLGDELRRKVHRSGNGDLLTEYRANGDFEAVPGARHAQTRALRHQWRKQRVPAEVIPDGQRVRVEIKNAPDASNDTG